MKTKKMNLNKLRLKSFVTEYNANKTNTMKGGTGPATIDTACTSHVGQNSVGSIKPVTYSRQSLKSLTFIQPPPLSL